jgi:hypothetical protein
MSTTNSSPPKMSDNDNMRLPAYRASYLGRYHPYPRTRVPAREAVMVCALLRSYSNRGALIAPHPSCSLLQKGNPPKRAGQRRTSTQSVIHLL